MARERIYLFDTTLRDGQQTPGVDFSLEDKLVVMDLLDEMGIDYIEGGYPGGNPTDTALFATERKTRATFTAFGRSRVDDADAAAGRATLGLGTLATQAANNVSITGGTLDGVTIDGGTF